MKPRTVHFEVPAENPAVLAAFYRATFGWSVSTWGSPMNAWSLVMGAADIAERTCIAYTPVGMACMANTVEVDNIDTYLMKITAAGGSVELEKQTVHSMGYFAYCADIEGNIFGLWQTDPNAA